MPGPLLQPAQGEPSGGYTVHKPHHRKPHPIVAKVDAPAPEATATAAAAPTAEAPPPVTQDASTPAPAPAKPAKRTHHTAAAAQATEASTGGLGFSFGEDEAPAPAPATPAPANNTRTASNEPPPEAAKPSKADVQQAGLAKRGAILFEHSSTDPQPSQMDGIKLLAGDLNSALEAGATQIQLQAFGGPVGDKGSEAKRISLRRALAIRQLLIDNGVPAAKIVTRAMGGVTDGGEADRVDIYVRAS